MSQLSKVAKYNTKIIREGLETRVRLYSTDVVAFCPERIILNTGGWQIVTTKNRMNQASNQFELGYYVFLRKGQMYCRMKDSTNAVPFSGNRLEIVRNHNANITQS